MPVSCGGESLFIDVPPEETIRILFQKAFKDNWFNRTYNFDLRRKQLFELLQEATRNQLFQFNGFLYEQKDLVAMGSP